jgi:7-cyano-7-deazaguanine synthase
MTAKSKQDKPAIVLLSGGLDSTTTLAIAQDKGYCVYALTLNYGQRHTFELEAARRIASEMGVEEHKTLTIDLREFGGSALTADWEVPKNRPEVTHDQEIPITYVPARNTIFLSLALAWAEVLPCDDIFIGVNALDYSGYPDCRPEFIQTFQQLANLATKRGVEEAQHLTIHTPLIHLTKAEIIRKGLALGVDYGLTHSCYDPDEEGHPCGQCDACHLRLKGFREVGVEDPLYYSQP